MNNNNYKCEISEYFKQLDFEYCEKNIEGLKELHNNNDKINVFWSCHKEPTDQIKNNFDYKLFPN